MRRFWLALCLLLVAVAARAETVTEFTLDNGMDVVVIEDHRSPAVTHMVWYRVGAADEPAGVSGIAHLLEHLMFKGTDTRAPGEFSELVEINGGSDNAFTSWDFTGYFQRVASDRLALMMELEADRMRNLRLTPELTAPELAVVLEERNQRVESNPSALFREQMRAAQYLNHPYGRPIIGWPQEIATLGQEEALDFYRAHYAPNNAILIVAGDVTPDEVRVLAETHYGPIPGNPDLGPRVRVTEPPQLAERRVLYEDPRIAQPFLARSYLAPERDSNAQETGAALALLADYLGGDQQTSYLAEKLQFEQQVALYASAFYDSMSLDASTFSFSVAPRGGVSLEEAEAALDAALEALLQDGLDPDRLARIKRQYAADLIYRKDSVGSLAREYGAALTSGLTVADVQAWPGIIEAVSAEDILAAAREVFDRRQSVTGFAYAPEAADPEVTQ